MYVERGNVRLTVKSRHGKKAVVAILGSGALFGEGVLAGQSRRSSTAQRRRGRPNRHGEDRRHAAEAPGRVGRVRLVQGAGPGHEHPHGGGPHPPGPQSLRTPARPRAPVAGALRRHPAISAPLPIISRNILAEMVDSPRAQVDLFIEQIPEARISHPQQRPGRRPAGASLHAERRAAGLNQPPLRAYTNDEDSISASRRRYAAVVPPGRVRADGQINRRQRRGRPRCRSSGRRPMRAAATCSGVPALLYEASKLAAIVLLFLR